MVQGQQVYMYSTIFCMSVKSMDVNVNFINRNLSSLEEESQEMSHTVAQADWQTEYLCWSTV